MFNDPKLVERMVPVLKRVLGDDKVVPSEASMGGEDYSEYGRAGIPIFMFQLGSVDAHRLAGFKRVSQNPPSLHSALYYPDAEETLVTGIGGHVVGRSRTAAAQEIALTRALDMPRRRP